MVREKTAKKKGGEDEGDEDEGNEDEGNEDEDSEDEGGGDENDEDEDDEDEDDEDEDDEDEDGWLRKFRPASVKTVCDYLKRWQTDGTYLRCFLETINDCFPYTPEVNTRLAKGSADLTIFLKVVSGSLLEAKELAGIYSKVVEKLRKKPGFGRQRKPGKLGQLPLQTAAALALIHLQQYKDSICINPTPAPIIDVVQDARLTNVQGLGSHLTVLEFWPNAKFSDTFWMRV